MKAKGIAVIALSFTERGKSDAVTESKDKNSEGDIVIKDGLDGAMYIERCGGKRIFTPVGQATALTDGTNGFLLSRNKVQFTFPYMIEGITSLPKIFEVDTTDCDMKIDTEISPTLPVTYSGSGSKVVSLKMKLRYTSCLSGRMFKCHYRFTESGAELPSSEVNFLNVNGCEGFLGIEPRQ